MLRTLTLIAMLGALAACVSAPQHTTASAKPTAAAPAPSKPPASTADAAGSVERKVMASTNAFRRQNALTVLVPNARLTRIAQDHARNMARQDRFGDSDENGHVLDGKDMESRIRAGGYAFGLVAENVGYQLNRTDPVAAMMEGWKNSPGHRRNMLLADVTEIGVGAGKGKSGRWYFVQLFGRPLEPLSANGAAR